MLPVDVPMSIKTLTAPPSEDESQLEKFWERSFREEHSQYDAQRSGGSELQRFEEEPEASGVGGREQYREDGEDQSRLLRAARATMRNLHFMLKVVESQQGELPDSSG